MLENAIEWFTNEKTATLTLSQIRQKNRIMKLKEKYPDDVEIRIPPEENGGYMIAKVPASWIRIMPPPQNVREWTEEEKDVLRKRLEEMRARKAAAKEAANVDEEAIDDQIADLEEEIKSED